MKVEYVTSPIGGGTELYISAAEYKRVNSKDGWSDRQNLCLQYDPILKQIKAGIRSRAEI